MNVETLQTMSKVAYILAAATFLASIFMFFLFRIPETFNELTGRAAKKFIAEAKKKNETTAIEQQKSAFGTSETLVSSDLLLPKSGSLSSATSEETTRLIPNTLAENHSQALPAVSPDAEFKIIEEFSFTGSKEIIE